MDHNNIIHVYSVTVMTHVKALEAGQSSQGTSQPITPVSFVYFSYMLLAIGFMNLLMYFIQIFNIYGKHKSKDMTRKNNSMTHVCTLRCFL